MHWTTYLLWFGFLGMAISCDPLELERVAFLQTREVTYDTQTGIAYVEAELFDLGEGPVIDHGHVWGINENPTLEDSKFSLGMADSLGTYVSFIQDLEVRESYFVRAFLTNSNGTFYSDPVVFSIPLLLDIDWVFVEGGSYVMGNNNAEDGDERPAHNVLVNDFFIGKYEITQREWIKTMGNNPSRNDFCEDCPVENVSWEDTQEFLETIQNRLGESWRLPTEAEWEYAAKGGKNKDSFVFSGSSNIGQVAWFDMNSGLSTRPVGAKQPNSLGIFDMSGNVFEWCSDWYGEKYYEESLENNPMGPIIGAERVLRGGSFDNAQIFARVTDRFKDQPDTRLFKYGFRVVKDFP